jgi:hypothetical protein
MKKATLNATGSRIVPRIPNDRYRTLVLLDMALEPIWALKQITPESGKASALLDDGRTTAPSSILHARVRDSRSRA